MLNRKHICQHHEYLLEQYSSDEDLIVAMYHKGYEDCLVDIKTHASSLQFFLDKEKE